MAQSWVWSMFGPRAENLAERSFAERRSAPRLEAKHSGAMIGWGEGDGLAIEPVEVVDISRTGLLMVGEAVPPDGLPIRVRFEDRRVAWVDATVVRIGRNEAPPHWIRAAFLVPCPDDVLAWVVGGGPIARPAPDPVPAEAPPPPGLRDALAVLGLGWPCDQAEVQAAFRRRSEAVEDGAEGALALRQALETALMACHCPVHEPEGASGTYLRAHPGHAPIA